VVDCRDDVTEATVTLDGSAQAVDRITVELRGSTLSITAPRDGGIFELARRRDREAVAVTVTVPSGTPVKITTFTAAITLNGRSGSADLASGSAVITAE